MADIKILLQKRVMPSIIVSDIKGVSPLIAPKETINVIVRSLNYLLLEASSDNCNAVNALATLATSSSVCAFANA